MSIAAQHSAHALPRFSLTSGTRCSACHFNPHGGGIRNELGWSTMNEVGAFRWPWSKEKPVDGDAGDDDLFNVPPDGATPPDDATTVDETPVDTASTTPDEELPTDDAPTEDDVTEGDVSDAFESGDPLPAHDATEVAEVTTESDATSGATTGTTTDATSATNAGDAPSTGASSAADDGTTSGTTPQTAAPDADESEFATNTFFDGLITPGVDIRLQLAKIGRPPNDTRMLLPMQTQVNLAITPNDWITVYGGVNASTLKYFFPGQSGWEATVQVQPAITLPILRVGYMQPSIGIRHDDHTMFVRREAAGTPKSLIPPGYAELGAEVTYEGLHWLTLNAGVFSSKNLADIETSLGVMTSIADFSKPSVLGRVQFWPQDLDLGINGEIGASYFANGELRLINVFAGFGVQNKGSFLVEGLFADYPDERRVRNLSVIGSYELFSWLSLDWRYEWGQFEDLIAGSTPQVLLAHAHQAVFGAEIFIMPGVELRPEYRLFQNEPFGQSDGYLQGQYTVQLHLFY
ncbi:MAG: hypothetical protein H7X80_07280 [bacterium]|nr:hypothetical protein [Candidatus Kapabacteria bacterium]